MRVCRRPLVRAASRRTVRRAALPFRAIRQRSLRLDHLNPQTQEFSFPAGQRLDVEEAPDDGPEAQQARKQRRKKSRL